MQLTALSNDELLRHATAQHDDLTATAVETELLRRFGALLDAENALGAVKDVMANHGIDETLTKDIERLERALNWEAEFDPAVYRDLLDALTEHDIDSPAVLRQILARDAELANVAGDLKQTLEKLSSLTETTPA